MCGDCKNKLEAKRRASQTFESWKAKVDAKGVWGKQPQPSSFINEQEHHQAFVCWKEHTQLTFDTWLQGHATRKNAKGLGSRNSLSHMRSKFTTDQEFQQAMNFWENNHKKTQSYINVLINQKKNKERNKAVRIQNGTGLETRICQHHGCNTQASFGLGEDGKRLYCVRHKDSGMVGLGKRQCKHPDCTTQPCYGPPGGKTEVCSQHARSFPEYVDLVTSKCQFQGCDIAASYGPPGTITRTHCSIHGTRMGLCDVATKRCSWDGCDVNGGFGFPDEKERRCVTHMDPGMVNVKRHKCKHDGCVSFAHYGQLGEYSTWCDKHKIQHDGVIFNPTQTCAEPMCKQYASHGYYHNSMHCVQHIQDKDISLIETMCGGCNLVDICLDGKCEHCSSFRVSDRKYDERHIKHLFDTTGIDYVHEEVVGNTRLVPDFLIHAPTHSIVVEIDEGQHKGSMYNTQNARYQSHDAEQLRMKDIHTGNPNIHVFIRYNPDEYDGHASTQDRHRVLLDVIAQATTTSYPHPCVVKLFYDHYTTPQFHALI